MNEAGLPKKTARRRGGKSAVDADRGPDFEESLGRLEAIVARLEAGELPLEETVRLFEEGQELVRACSGLLERAEQRVKILIAGTDETRDLAAPGPGSAGGPGEAGGAAPGSQSPGRTARAAADREGTDA